jgi:hypothetical protein
MFTQTWLLPFSLLATAAIIAFPLSRYLTFIVVFISQSSPHDYADIIWRNTA